MKVSWLIVASALVLSSLALKLEDIAQGEDDGTMTSVTVVSPGVWRVVAPNHDSYMRYTLSSGCYNLNSFRYMKLKAMAAPGSEFTIELRQGFDDCRLDLWPYVRDSTGALISHYTAKGTFDGTLQDVWIPMSHFTVDRTKIAQVFISSMVVVGSPEITTVQYGNVEFTNDDPTMSVAPIMPQNPTTWNCEKPYTFAITFDNQKSGNLDQILDTLQTHDAKCTIFQIAGDLVEDDTAMKRLIREGHQVAHHTWTHPGMTELTEEQIRREMVLTDEALKARLGVSTKWFRPPFGQQDPRVRKILYDMGYVSVIWNIDSTDYFNQDNGPLIWSRIQARLDKMDPARTGGVLLLHNDVKPSADLVERVILYAKSRGFRDFVTMEECMAGKFDSFLGVNSATSGAGRTPANESPASEAPIATTSSPSTSVGAGFDQPGDEGNDQQNQSGGGSAANPQTGGAGAGSIAEPAQGGNTVITAPNQTPSGGALVNPTSPESDRDDDDYNGALAMSIWVSIFTVILMTIARYIM